VGDIDAPPQRVHIRDSKGHNDRFVPLPDAMLTLLRRFWSVHRNPVRLFPNCHGGLKVALRATGPLDRGGLQTTLRKAATECGIKSGPFHKTTNSFRERRGYCCPAHSFAPSRLPPAWASGDARRGHR
jgi:integrase